MGRFEEEKLRHLGKLPRSIHGKLPIERHSSQWTSDQTYIFFKFLFYFILCIVGVIVALLACGLG
jgi:hypothetical protein